jgi:hypothetical protein
MQFNALRSQSFCRFSSGYVYCHRCQALVVVDQQYNMVDVTIAILPWQPEPGLAAFYVFIVRINQAGWAK